MGLLCSGFVPKTCPVLAEKLEKVHNTQLANVVGKFKITVPMSCSAMVIPGMSIDEIACIARRTHTHNKTHAIHRFSRKAKSTLKSTKQMGVSLDVLLKTLFAATFW